ncbi:medium-chain acyl-CoA ligase ACSF2, mitochondrial-like [Strongylocentrotus purpuratus]|uniref:Medium-chain acyl-CoA ligase ACSF2, mitochondrial n=1 Tax=Strongylocentrotus purpuratus TaxID=7668 RepID=A0A7M7NI54_STRPU|nr:medium-chain acyl-CoA ligase ACSF2, mitochondrial-like [Strongylocentrotus purpuratus]
MSGLLRYGLLLKPRLRIGALSRLIRGPVRQPSGIEGSLSSCIRTKYTTSYVHGHDHFPNPPALVGKTLGKVLDEMTEKHPDQDFVVFCEDGVRRTFHQFQQEVDRLAAGLVSIGAKRGDRIGIWGPNSLEWTLTLFACARLGAILVNLNPAYVENELEYALKKANIKLIVASTPFRTMRYYDILASICPELERSPPGHLNSQRLPDLKSVIIMGNDQHPGSLVFNDVIDMGREEHYDIIEQRKKSVQFDDIINIQFTSGTTGHPKATCLTHFQLINNMVILESVTNVVGIDKAGCVPMPLFHCGGMSYLILGLVFGSKTVFPSAGFDATACLRAIHEERCAHLIMVPTMVIDFLQHPKLSTFDLSPLQSLSSGGSAVPSQVRRDAEELLKVKTKVLYGMTEAALGVLVSLDTDPESARMKPAGRAFPWIEIKITNPSTDEIVDVNTPGELCIRGPCVMSGYFDDDEKTKETIDQARWLHSGDLASMDEDGYVEILSRIKDMVIRGGENIFPVQIEMLLHKHPKIKDVQVIGVPDARMIEELCACVKLKEGETLTEDEIKNFCKGKISHFMVPRYVRFVNSYPLTQSGKIQKFQLREDIIKVMRKEGILNE